MPFIVVTLLVYIILPALHKNLHGKCFVCYLICQGICFIVEIIYYYNILELNAKIVNYLFLCTFQWLNVTAFDAWWNLRSFRWVKWKLNIVRIDKERPLFWIIRWNRPKYIIYQIADKTFEFVHFYRSVSESSKSSERKRFIVYILYALLSPFLHNIFHEFSDILKSNNKQMIYFDNTTQPIEIYKVNPELADDLIKAAFIGITFTVNIVFFILTTLKIREVRKEIDKMTSKEDSTRHQKRLTIEKGK